MTLTGLPELRCCALTVLNPGTVCTNTMMRNMRSRSERARTGHLCLPGKSPRGFVNSVWCRCIRNLLLFFLQTLVQTLRGFVLQLLKHCKRLLSVFRAVKTPVDDAELIPGLLHGVGVGVRSGDFPVEGLGGGGIISKFHLGTAQVVR